MAIQSSGALAISDLKDEFGGTAPHGMSEYYDADPWIGVPQSGNLDLTDFYGGSVRTARMNTIGEEVNGILRSRYSQYEYLRGSRMGYGDSTTNFVWPEYDTVTPSAIGSISRSSGLLTDGHNFKGLHGYFQNVNGQWITSVNSRPHYYYIVITTDKNANTGFTTVKINDTSSTYGTTEASLNRADAYQFQPVDTGSGTSTSRFQWTWRVVMSGPPGYSSNPDWNDATSSGNTIRAFLKIQNAINNSTARPLRIKFI